MKLNFLKNEVNIILNAKEFKILFDEIKFYINEDFINGHTESPLNELFDQMDLEVPLDFFANIDKS